MGLGTSHDCWHGAYSSFGKWRRLVAEAAGLPPLEMMAGFGKPHISWECLKETPLLCLLNHSDCDGKITWPECGPLADALEALPDLPDDDEDGYADYWRVKTLEFIKGLRLAASLKEDVRFH